MKSNAEKGVMTDYAWSNAHGEKYMQGESLFSNTMKNAIAPVINLINQILEGNYMRYASPFGN